MHEHLSVGKQIDRSQLMLRGALIPAGLAIILAAVPIGFGEDSYALPLVIGCAFTAIVHLTTGPRTPFRGMAWVIIWLFGATLLGGLVSPWGWPELVIVALVGLVGGYVGVLGPRAAVIGVVSMQVYTVFAGLNMTPVHALKFAALLAGGGLVYLAVVAAAGLARTQRGGSLPPEAPASLPTRLDLRHPMKTHFGAHALRLSMALVIGTAISHNIGWPHPYWIPMTIVLVSKPDADGTTTRVISRLMGTLLGVGVTLLLVLGVGDGPVTASIYAGLGVFVMLTFTKANYPISVSGTTAMIMTLMMLAGDPIVSTDTFRVLATILGGAIALAFGLLLRRRRVDA